MKKLVYEELDSDNFQNIIIRVVFGIIAGWVIIRMSIQSIDLDFGDFMTLFLLGMAIIIVMSFPKKFKTMKNSKTIYRYNEGLKVLTKVRIENDTEERTEFKLSGIEKISVKEVEDPDGPNATAWDVCLARKDLDDKVVIRHFTNYQANKLQEVIAFWSQIPAEKNGSLLEITTSPIEE